MRWSRLGGWEGMDRSGYALVVKPTALDGSLYIEAKKKGRFMGIFWIFDLSN